MTQTLNVQLEGRAYPILIGQGLLRDFSWLEKTKRKAFVLSDDTVGKLYGEAFAAKLKDYYSGVEIFNMPAGEASKSFAQYETVMEWLTQNKVNRDSVLFVIGGGVVGDLGGFAAATILRGIDFIQVPTSLLAQVDSSVGGKTGINSKFGKNLIGSFYQPQKVIIDTDVLKTLPKREMQAGYAEIFKYALLGDAEFFTWLEENGAAVLNGDTDKLVYAIHKSCTMKADIVAQDERETNGQRALLNLGHTFAHAIEAAYNYDGRVLHGEAVGIGLNLAARLSQHLGYIDEADAKRIENHLRELNLKSEIKHVEPALSLQAADYLSLMSRDKKATADGLTFVVLNKIGEAGLQNKIDENIVLKILEEWLI